MSVPAFLTSFHLTLFKTDITLRRTLGAGHKDFRLRESWQDLDFALAETKMWRKKKRPGPLIIPRFNPVKNLPEVFFKARVLLICSLIKEIITQIKMLYGKAFTVYFCCKLRFLFSGDWLKLLVCQGVLEFKIWTFFRSELSFLCLPPWWLYQHKFLIKSLLSQWGPLNPSRHLHW